MTRVDAVEGILTLANLAGGMTGSGTVQGRKDALLAASGVRVKLGVTDEELTEASRAMLQKLLMLQLRGTVD